MAGWSPFRVSGPDLTCGSVRLWRSVVALAIADALEDARGPTPADKAQARRWLLAGGPDFVAACERAGVDAPGLRRRAHALAADGWRLAVEEDRAPKPPRPRGPRPPPGARRPRGRPPKQPARVAA
jgi:hypothetical protein